MPTPETTAATARRETDATRLGLVLDRPDDTESTPVTYRGRHIGDVMRGVNGEWYAVPLSAIERAYPLEGLDNVSGTGCGSALSAALNLA